MTALAAVPPPPDPYTAAARRGAVDGLERVMAAMRRIQRLTDQLDPSDDGDSDERPSH